MPKGILTYSPADVDCYILGKKVIGFPAGSFVKVKKRENNYKESFSMDGSVELTLQNKQTFDITFTLQQTSAINDVLSTLNDIALRKSFYVPLPILIRDSKGGSTFFCTNSWISATPEMEFGNTLVPRTWTLTTTSGQIFVGGNDSGDTFAKIARVIEAGIVLSEMWGAGSGIVDILKGGLQELGF